MRHARTFMLELLDRRCLFSASYAAIEPVTLTFQDGLSGYNDTSDTGLRATSPNTSFATNSRLDVDRDTDGAISGDQPAQALIKFFDLFGDGAGQIPDGAAVTSATLTLFTGSESTDVSNHAAALHRMLQSWSEAATWNSMGSGISANGAEAATSPDSTAVPLTRSAGVTFDVTATLQAWAADPSKNLGWAVLPGGGDGWRLQSSETTTTSGRPRLSVTFDSTSEPNANQAPVVSAGPDRSIALAGLAALDGTVRDDGLPNPPANLLTTWTKRSGPGTVTFDDSAAVDTTASFSAAGTYVLRLTADDGALQASDDVTVVVNDGSNFKIPLSKMPLSSDTGEKPQSKLWKHDGAWWSVLPNSSGTWLWRLDGTQWSSVLKLSSATNTRADALPAGNVTHVLLYAGTSSTKLASVEYVPGSSGAPGTYKMWSKRTSLASVPLNSGSETATIAMDAAGRMWVAYDADTTVRVRYSDGTYGSWSNSITLASGTKSDDIAAITALPNGSVAVMWSNQTTKRFGFKTHAPGTSASSWSADEVPGSQSALSIGAGMADDHINLAVASDGTVYAAVKTGYDKSGYAGAALLVRRPNGMWDNLYTVDGPGNTRPIVVLNEAANSLMVIYTRTNDTGSGNILYRRASLSNLSFGPVTTLMSGALNNPSSTKQNIDGDLLIIATDTSRVLNGLHLSWPTA